MPQPTYTPLATVTLGSSASSVTFSSIPATYRDLILVFGGTRTTTNNIQIRFNGDTGSNYSWVNAYGFSGGADSGSQTLSFMALTSVSLVASEQVNTIVNFMDYSATDKHKTVLSRLSQAGAVAQMNAHRWANTAAVTSILFYADVGDFGAGSVFSLYGIAS